MRPDVKRRCAIWVAIVLPWLLVLLFPGTRALLIVTSSRDSPMESPVPSYSYENDFSFANLKSLFPHDIQIQVGDAKGENIQSDGEYTARDLHKIAHRFPHSPLPTADYLRFALGWLRDVRLAGDLEYRKPPPYNPSPERRFSYVYPTPAPGPPTTPGAPSGAPPSFPQPAPPPGDPAPNSLATPPQALPSRPPPAPTIVFNKPDFSRAQWNEAVAVARHGQRLEPNNAYFDWVLSCLLLMQCQDSQARHFLYTASHKPYYDDHIRESMAASIHTMERERPLWLEEKLGYLVMEPFTHLSTMHHCALLLSWQAWKWKRTGKAGAALLLNADLARLGYLFLQSDTPIATRKFGTVLESIAWAPHSYRRDSDIYIFPMDNGARIRHEAESFAAAARAHGTSDIARETQHEAQDTERFAQSVQSDTLFLLCRGAVSHRTLYWVRALWWFSVGALKLAPCLAVVAAALSLLLLRTAPLQDARLTRVWPVVLPSALLPVLVACIVLHSEVQVDTFLTINDDPNRYSRAFDNMQSVNWALAAAIIPFLLPALMCGIVGYFQLYRWRRDHPKPPEPSHVPRDTRPLIWAFLTGTSVLSAVGGWLGSLLAWYLSPIGQIFYDPVTGGSLYGEELAAWDAIIGSWGSALWFFGWLIKWRFFSPRDERLLAHGVLRRYRLAMSSLLIFTGWAYLAVLCLSLIPRHMAAAQFEAYLRRGAGVNGEYHAR